MGACFSKKKPHPSPPPHPIPIPNDDKKEESKFSHKLAAEEPHPAAAENKSPPPPPPVFVIAQAPKNTKTATASEEEKKNEKKEDSAAAVRTSSCTKEEVDAILIQCGRLSRSSSGKASNDAGRKYSGSKRSYDFDNERNRDEDEEWVEKPISRPSPHRRTPNRDHKRSGSRERGNGGSRRVSRSPGRRSDGPASSSVADKVKQQPAKMVSVPAREKGASAAASEVGVKRVTPSGSNNKRNASPRSRSPARILSENAAANHPPQPQSLSRSSSRKAEHSPYRRNPMAEIDDNSLKVNQNTNTTTTNKALKNRQGEEEGLRKAAQTQTQRPADVTNGSKTSNNKNSNVITSCVREQLMSCRAKEKHPEPEVVEEAKEGRGGSSCKGGVDPESLNSQRNIAKNRSSRRSSRDLDHVLDLNQDTLRNPSAYTSLLLEDIQNYHQQNAAFSLPACVSKACSILEAVADLNSSSSDQSSNKDNGRFGKKLMPNEPFLESEVVVKDDLVEPSLHKYVAVRDLGSDMEPQESAGSNSFIGQPWASSWEPNSVDSTDQYWTSRSVHGDEGEEYPLPEAACDVDVHGRRLRSGGSASSGKNREIDQHQLRRRGGSGKGGGGRAASLPVAAASSY